MAQLILQNHFDSLTCFEAVIYKEDEEGLILLQDTIKKYTMQSNGNDNGNSNSKGNGNSKGNSNGNGNSNSNGKIINKCNCNKTKYLI